MIFERGNRPVSTLTNLNPQPYPSSDLVGWNPNYATGGAGNATYETVGGVYGLPFYRMTWTTGSTEVNRGAERTLYAANGQVLVPGATYTASVYVRSSRAQSIVIAALPTTSAGVGIQTFTGSVVPMSANVWTHHPVTFVAPADSYAINIRAYASTGGSNWQAGDMLDMTAVMLTVGLPVPYFDGNTPGASWAGVAGASTSSTLALMGIYPLGRLAEMGSIIHASGNTAGNNYALADGAFSSAAQYTEYSAHSAGTTTHRANFLNGTTSLMATGRNSGGTGWFMLALNPASTATTVAITRATGPNVIAGVREELVVRIHSFAGNISAQLAIAGYPPAGTFGSFATMNASPDVRYVELWSGAHAADIRYARMAQIRTQYGINI